MAIGSCKNEALSCNELTHIAIGSCKNEALSCDDGAVGTSTVVGSVVLSVSDTFTCPPLISYEHYVMPYYYVHTIIIHIGVKTSILYMHDISAYANVEHALISFMNELSWLRESVDAQPILH